MIGNQYEGELAILYDRALRYRDTLWNFDINVPIRIMTGSLEAAQQPFARDTEAFHNPKLTKIEVTIEGASNQLYSQGLRPYQMWDEVRKYFAAGSKGHSDVSAAAKDLALADVSLGGFLSNKYALWLDLRTTDDDQLHGNDRRISEEMIIQIQKEAEVASLLNMYVYLICDAELDIQDGRLVQATFQRPPAADGTFGDHMWADGM